MLLALQVFHGGEVAEVSSSPHTEWPSGQVAPRDTRPRDLAQHLPAGPAAAS